MHGGAGWFQNKGDFPNPRDTERPLAREAQRFYANGPPVLQRYLPFWAANLVDRMWPAILTIVAVADAAVARAAAALQLPHPLAGLPLVPPAARGRAAIGKRPNDELLKELDAIETQVEKVTVPLSYADELYALRAHIHMVAERLIDPAAPVQPAAAGKPP